MATSSTPKAPKKVTKVIVTGDDINPTLAKDFADIVGGSLEGERTVWLKGVDLMKGGIVTVAGMKATLEHNFEKVGSLPTLTPSSVQYWGKMKALHDLEGGSAYTLKELEKLARDLSAVHNGKNGAKTFAQAVEGAKVEKLRKATPNHNKTRKAHTDNKKGAEFSQEKVVEKLLNALENGECTISLELAVKLYEALVDYSAELEGMAA